MKKTFAKFSIYVFVLIGIHYFAAMRAGSYFDPFYLRFTTGQHASMVVGTSRAAQGILPEVLNRELGGEYTTIANFGFTIVNSPYGEVYLNAMRQKLDTTKQPKKNIFIVSVDPWSITTKNNPTDDVALYREQNLFLDKMKTIGKVGKPNFEYLSKGYAESWGKILYRPITNKRRMCLHEDGWLEVNVPMNESAVQKRQTAKVENYTNLLIHYALSNNRLYELGQTIDFLKQHGEVVLVRLPISSEIYDIEKQLMPDFDEKMCLLSQKYTVPYWSFIDKLSEYTYTDGNHLYKDSGRKISKEIAQMIRYNITSSCRQPNSFIGD